MRARELLQKDSAEWRRATDIVLTSNLPTRTSRTWPRKAPVTSGLRR